MFIFYVVEKNRQFYRFFKLILGPWRFFCKTKQNRVSETSKIYFLNGKSRALDTAKLWPRPDYEPMPHCSAASFSAARGRIAISNIKLKQNGISARFYARLPSITFF